MQQKLTLFTGVLLLFFLFCFDWPQEKTFKQKQQRYPRVRSAYLAKGKLLENTLANHQIELNEMELFLRAFKQEEIIEVYAKKKSSLQYSLIKVYPFCSNSGILGPKRVEGDAQIPEGFYSISAFNPYSNFYLSLKVDYPNASDAVLSHQKYPGSNIFIHGNCVTIGCIPITDDKIKELYILCVEAKNNGAKTIPIHLFPFKFGENKIENTIRQYPEYAEHQKFWNELAVGFDFFEKNKTLPTITVTENGHYTID